MTTEVAEKQPSEFVPLIWRCGPAHWPFHAAVVTLSLLMLLAGVLTRLLPLDVLYLLSLVIMATWLAIGGIWLVACFAPAEPRRSDEWRILKWWIAPVIVLFMYDSHGAHVVQFWAKRPYMEQRMRELATAPPSGRKTTDGADEFDGGDTHRFSNGTFRFRHGIGHFLDWNGFAYSPADLSEESEWSSYKRISGPWYLYYGG